MVELCR
nr:BLTX628 [Nephila pilipes]